MKGRLQPLLVSIFSVCFGLTYGQKAGPRGAIAASEPFPWDTVDPFDYYTFAQIYPAAVSRANFDSCVLPQDSPQWTIHGLWPNYKDGSFPQFCDNRKFDASNVAPIRRKLELNWPNIFPEKTTDSFWEYEWQKHGTCAKGESLADSESDYFNESLNLHFRLDIFAALTEDGILPSDRAIRRNVVEHAMGEEVSDGRKVQLHCLKDKKSGQWLLADVRVCIDLRLRHPIDCPEEILADSERTRQLGNSKERPLPEFTKCPDVFYYPRKDSILPLASSSSEEFCTALSFPFILGEVVLLLIAVLLLSALVVLACRRFNRSLQVKDLQKKELDNLMNFGKPLLFEYDKLETNAFINPGMRQITDDKFDINTPDANLFRWVEKSNGKFHTGQ